MSVEIYPSAAKIKRNGVYQNLPAFVSESDDNAAQQMIATAESSNVAQYKHEVGDYFRLNDVLYETTNTINIGDNIVVGTNCKVAVLANDVSSLKKDHTDFKEYFTLQDVAGNNLYDDANPTIVDGFISASGDQAGQCHFAASWAAKCLCIPVEPSKEYTLSKSSTIGRLIFGFFDDIPTNNQIGTYSEVVHPVYITENKRNYVTFTTPQSAQYLVFYYFNSNDGIAETQIRATVMLTEGAERIPYEPYSLVKMLKIIKDNLNPNGSEGQALMLDSNNELIWVTPAVPLELDNTLTQQGKAADAKATGDAIVAAKEDLEDQLGQVVLTQGVQEWLDDHPEAMIVIKTNGDVEDAPTLGEELLPSSGWETTGWTGDFTNGFTHVTGNTNPISCQIDALEAGALYQFKITTSNAAANGWSDFFVSVGGSDRFETYKGGGASVSYVYGIICGNTKVLTITPRNDYTGTITALSLKKVSNTVGILYELRDSDGNVTYEVRTAKAALNDIYLGNDSGVKSFWGYENTAIGDSALENNTSGFWNTALGRRALQSNQNGSRNIAIGYIALRANTGGDRNVAIGSFTLEKNTTGRNNVAINADALQDNTTGHDNIGIGVRADVGNTTGFYNIGIGNNANAANKTGSGNVAIGQNALQNATGSNNIAIGNGAGDASGMTGNNNIVIGWNADVPTPSGNNQMVLGNPSITSVIIAGKTITFNPDGTVTWS